MKGHCRHCGKLFCSDCVQAKTPIKRLRYTTPGMLWVRGEGVRERERGVSERGGSERGSERGEGERE